MNNFCAPVMSATGSWLQNFVRTRLKTNWEVFLVVRNKDLEVVKQSLWLICHGGEKRGYQGYFTFVA